MNKRREEFINMCKNTYIPMFEHTRIPRRLAPAVDMKYIDVLKYYNSLYLNKNDPQHKLGHVIDVAYTFLSLVKENIEDIREELNILKKEDGYDDVIMYVCFLTAVIHDIYVWKDRDIHHMLAAEHILLKKDMFIKRLKRLVIGYSTTNIFDIMAEIVYHHRASEKYRRNSILVSLFRIADKGIPDFKNILDRMNIISVLEKDIDDLTQFEIEKLQHLKEKYGVDGYLYANDQYYYKTYKDKCDDVIFKVEKLCEKFKIGG